MRMVFINNYDFHSFWPFVKYLFRAPKNLNFLTNTVRTLFVEQVHLSIISQTSNFQMKNGFFHQIFFLSLLLFYTLCSNFFIVKKMLAIFWSTCSPAKRSLFFVHPLFLNILFYYTLLHNPNLMDLR